MDESALITGLILLIAGLFGTWLINRRGTTPPEYMDEETERWLNNGKGLINNIASTSSVTTVGELVEPRR